MRRCRAEASGESVSQEVSDDVSDPVSGGVKQIQWRSSPRKEIYLRIGSLLVEKELNRVSTRLGRTLHTNSFTKEPCSADHGVVLLLLASVDEYHAICTVPRCVT